MALTNEQLIMLDALAYYSRFSDYLVDNAKATVGAAVEAIITGKNTLALMIS